MFEGNYKKEGEKNYLAHLMNIKSARYPKRQQRKRICNKIKDLTNSDVETSQKVIKLFEFRPESTHSSTLLQKCFQNFK